MTPVSEPVGPTPSSGHNKWWISIAVAAAIACVAVAAFFLLRPSGSKAPSVSTLAQNESDMQSELNEQATNKTFTVEGVLFNMVLVDGGTFMMGATSEQGSDAENDEMPAHQVTLSAYMIGETEVTQALWEAVMGSNPSSFTGDTNRPVENVSWDDCQIFIRKLNAATEGQRPEGRSFRLPTEAEWEFAARRGNKSKGYKYSGSNNIDDVAWFTVNSYDKGESNPDYGTHPVGKKSPNELGLYDMSGNVWEWCQDWYDENFYSKSSSTNPCNNTSASYRVIRGGSWDIDALYCRVSDRDRFTPDDTNDILGLRLAL